MTHFTPTRQGNSDLFTAGFRAHRPAEIFSSFCCWTSAVSSRSLVLTFNFSRVDSVSKASDRPVDLGHEKGRNMPSANRRVFGLVLMWCGEKWVCFTFMWNLVQKHITALWYLLLFFHFFFKFYKLNICTLVFDLFPLPSPSGIDIIWIGYSRQLLM